MKTSSFRELVDAAHEAQQEEAFLDNATKAWVWIKGAARAMWQRMLARPVTIRSFREAMSLYKRLVLRTGLGDLGWVIGVATFPEETRYFFIIRGEEIPPGVSPPFDHTARLTPEGDGWVVAEIADPENIPSKFLPASVRRKVGLV